MHDPSTSTVDRHTSPNGDLTTTSPAIGPVRRQTTVIGSPVTHVAVGLEAVSTDVPRAAVTTTEADVEGR